MEQQLKLTALVTHDLVSTFLQLVDQVKLSPGQPGAVETMAKLAELREEAVRALTPEQPELDSD